MAKENIKGFDAALYNTLLGVTGIMAVLAMTSLVSQVNWQLNYYMSNFTISQAARTSNLAIQLPPDNASKFSSALVSIVVSLALLVLLFKKGKKDDGTIIGHHKLYFAIVSALFSFAAFWILFTTIVTLTTTTLFECIGSIMFVSALTVIKMSTIKKYLEKAKQKFGVAGI